MRLRAVGKMRPDLFFAALIILLATTILSGCITTPATSISSQPDPQGPGSRTRPSPTATTPTHQQTDTGSTQKNRAAWKLVPGANPEKYSVLNGVSGSSSHDVWAVGSSTQAYEDGTTMHPIIEHWDGKQWSAVPSPNPQNTLGSISRLNAVTAISPTSAWAVGATAASPHGAVFAALIEHWDGVAWNIVNAPFSISSSIATELTAVAAVADNDVWVIGRGYDSSTESRIFGLVMHWDGKQWNLATDRNGSFRSISPTGLVTITTNDVWVTGWNAGSAATVHWDGKQWNNVPLATGTPHSSSLSAMTALAPNNIWAVGAVNPSSDAPDALIEHWDGVAWSIVTGPPHTGKTMSLVDVVALSSDDIWAIGNSGAPAGGFGLALVHWDGSNWTNVTSPAPTTGPSDPCQFRGATLAGDAEWVVGDCNSQGSLTMVR